MGDYHTVVLHNADRCGASYWVRAGVIKASVSKTGPSTRQRASLANVAIIHSFQNHSSPLTEIRKNLQESHQTFTSFYWSFHQNCRSTYSSWCRSFRFPVLDIYGLEPTTYLHLYHSDWDSLLSWQQKQHIECILSSLMLITMQSMGE